MIGKKISFRHFFSQARNWRRLSQLGFLGLFLFLFLTTRNTGDNQLGYPVKFFLHLDPLHALTQMLSGNALPAIFFLALGVALFTAVMGRFFCGWVCPFGTLNHIVSKLQPLFAHKQKKTPDWDFVKYYILIFVLAGALFSLPLAGFLDPISLLIRSFTITFYPLFDFAGKEFFHALSETPIISPLSEPIYQSLRDKIFLIKDIYYMQAFFIGVLFLAILALNIWVKRFWCRYLCPLGALIGLLSKYSWFGKRHVSSCSGCMACSRDCDVNALPDSNETWKRSECLYLFQCTSACSTKELSFGFRKAEAGTPSVNMGRKRTLSALGVALLSLPLLKITPVARWKLLNPALIRPPGAKPEADFLSLCIKCGECMKVCPTGGLQPTLFEAGLSGMWTPFLVPRLGYCEYSCTLCAQVCPTQAIAPLNLKKKQKTKIGIAIIDRDTCLPHAHKIGCIVCEEVCPTAPKAIELDLVTVKGSSNSYSGGNLKLPKVNLERCIGCGICETSCPLVSKPAIFVQSFGESRSRKNSLS